MTLYFDTNPATAALEAAQRRLSLKSDIADDILSSQVVTMTFETESFPAIAWDVSDEDSSQVSDTSSSSSLSSSSDWSSVLNDFTFLEAASKSGRSKRSRSNEERLVRSKKIKSNLSSLARVSSRSS